MNHFAKLCWFSSQELLYFNKKHKTFTIFWNLQFFLHTTKVFLPSDSSLYKYYICVLKFWIQICRLTSYYFETSCWVLIPILNDFCVFSTLKCTESKSSGYYMEIWILNRDKEGFFAQFKSTQTLQQLQGCSQAALGSKCSRNQ